MRLATVGVGDGVVDVALDGGLIATGRPAGEVTEPDKPGQLGRRAIAPLGDDIDR